MRFLTGHTRVAGVIGWPVAHSRSPMLHGIWLRRHAIDGAYVPLPVQPGHFEQAVRGLAACGFAGANVTIPHKEAAFAVCDRLDDAATRAGAVNTLVFRDGAIHGTNTDGFGFIENLRAHGVDPASGPVLLLGAGGSARAVAAALAALGVPVTLCNRTRARAEALQAAIPGTAVLDWDRRGEALADHALAVNATPSGMAGQDDLLALDFSRAAPGLVAADLVYVPLVTPFLAQAEAAGRRAVGGLGMLLHQGRPGFAAWFGTEPVVDQALHDMIAADLTGTDSARK